MAEIGDVSSDSDLIIRYIAEGKDVNPAPKERSSTRILCVPWVGERGKSRFKKDTSWRDQEIRVEPSAS